MLCTNIRKQKDINAIAVLGKQQVTASQLYQGKKQDMKIQNMILLFAEDVVWIIGLFLVVYVSERPIFHLSLSRS